MACKDGCRRFPLALSDQRRSVPSSPPLANTLPLPSPNKFSDRVVTGPLCPLKHRRQEPYNQILILAFTKQVSREQQHKSSKFTKKQILYAHTFHHKRMVWSLLEVSTILSSLFDSLRTKHVSTRGNDLQKKRRNLKFLLSTFVYTPLLLLTSCS